MTRYGPIGGSLSILSTVAFVGCLFLRVEIAASSVPTYDYRSFGHVLAARS